MTRAKSIHENTGVENVSHGQVHAVLLLSYVASSSYFYAKGREVFILLGPSTSSPLASSVTRAAFTSTLSRQPTLHPGGPTPPGSRLKRGYSGCAAPCSLSGGRADSAALFLRQMSRWSPARVTRGAAASLFLPCGKQRCAVCRRRLCHLGRPPCPLEGEKNE